MSKKRVEINGGRFCKERVSVDGEEFISGGGGVKVKAVHTSDFVVVRATLSTEPSQRVVGR